MDSFDIDNVKAEKANAMQRYRRFGKIEKLLRFVEICLAMILLYWFSARLPLAVKISGEYFRDFYVVLVNPRFVFLVGNTIVLVLLAKSGQFSGNSAEKSSGTDLYEEFIKNSENRQKISTGRSTAAPEERVHEDKHTVCEGNSLAVTAKATETKNYRRTQSENLKHVTFLEPVRELRRSETEKCRKVDNSDKKVEKTSCSEEEMNNEEFRRRVDAFIAKQRRFRREESMAIVLQNQS